MKSEWVALKETPTTEEDKRRSVSPDKLPAMKRAFGYAPEREVETTETVKVLEQIVEKLDLVKVIAAINGMPAE
jgi:hypothetical protein